MGAIRWGLLLSRGANGIWLADGVMRQEMSTWQYPYHFIDFETSTVAIPFHAGMRPYEAVAFQFSHHVMQSDGSVAHVCGGGGCGDAFEDSGGVVAVL